jgi:glycosyltransferase involved in cell wall biosynthesis
MNSVSARTKLQASPRVAQVIGTFGGGGAQRMAYNLAVGLAAQGAYSLAIALKTEGNFANAAGDEIRIVALGADRLKPLSIIKAFRGLRRLIREERLDVLHAHGAPSLPMVVLALLGLRPKPKLAFTWHDSESVLTHRGWRRWLMVWALKRCNSVTGSSRAVAEKLAAGARLQGVGVFHGGVPGRPIPTRHATASPLILWLGRVVPSKDPVILIRAAARLKSEGLRFSVCVAGSPIEHTGWYMAEVKALIDRLGLVDVVSTPGFVVGDELQNLLSTAEIAVQTSHTEGLSIALLEQMMSGLAIVATDVGDTESAIENGISGLLVPPKDEDALADALRRLLSDLVQRQRIAEAAREHAVEYYSIQAMASRALETYRVLIGQG